MCRWVKPALGIYSRNGSTANNILLEDSGVSVFLDRNPTAKSSEQWKMTCSNAVYGSPDGIKWHKIPTKSPTGPIQHSDDTKPTGAWDPRLRKYVIFVRRDVSQGRCIGRCETTDFANWESETPDGCPTVFCADSEDPIHLDGGLDVYTNAWTPYPSSETLCIER